MKDLVTDFDINAAFKALDEIDYPKIADGLRANRVNLKEAIIKGPQTDSLLEDYFDVNDKEDLEAAQDMLDADSAEDKLKKVQEIIDPDAEVPEDLVKSFDGQAAILCPQCRNVYYKDPKDIIPEEAKVGDTVNEGEECIQCHHKDGFKLVGYISEHEVPAEEKPEEEKIDIEAEENIPKEEKVDELNLEQPAEEKAEEEVELEEIPAEDEEQEEKKEESLIQPSGEVLNEQVKNTLTEANNDLDKKLAEHNEYIEVLQAEIKKEDEAIKEAKNDFIKKMHEENLESLKAALDKAIPEEVKSEVENNEADDLPAPEEVIEKEDVEEVKDSLKEAKEIVAKHIDDLWSVKIGDNVLEVGSKEECQQFIKNHKETDAEKAHGGLKLVKGADVNMIKDSLKENCNENCDKECKEELTPEEQARFDEISKDGIIRAKDRYEFQQLVSKAKEEPKKNKPEDLLQEDEKEAVVAKEIENDAEAQAYLEKELEKPISDEEVSGLVAEELRGHDYSKEIAANEANAEFEGNQDESGFDEVDDFDENSFDNQITEYLTKVYKNVADFKTTNCQVNENKLVVEGKINFKSGKTANSKFIFESAKYNKNDAYITFKGCNEAFSKDNVFALKCTRQDGGKTLFTESINYRYFINESLVEGSTKNNNE